MTHAEIAEEIHLSTSQVKRDCADLLDAGLINSRKRMERRGKGSWEYWKIKLPDAGNIETAATLESALERMEELGFLSRPGYGGIKAKNLKTNKRISNANDRIRTSGLS
jgi:hypothetical protein